MICSRTFDQFRSRTRDVRPETRTTGGARVQLLDEILDLRRPSDPVEDSLRCVGVGDKGAGSPCTPLRITIDLPRAPPARRRASTKWGGIGTGRVQTSGLFRPSSPSPFKVLTAEQPFTTPHAEDRFWLFGGSGRAASGSHVGRRQSEARPDSPQVRRTTPNADPPPTTSRLSLEASRRH